MYKPKRRKVLFTSGEAVPFAKVGGLADVVSALSKALTQENQDVRIMIPKYRSVSDFMHKHHIKPEFIYRVFVSVNEIEYPFTVEEVSYGENKFIFIDIPEFFDRDNPYIDVVTGKEFNDNLIRYTIFDRAVLETCKVISWIPDIIHCHDWHMGLIPLFKQALPEYSTVFQDTKTVFTIHNLGYQGVFSVDQYPNLGIDWKYFHINGIEYYRHINFMKSGIVFSNAVNTVSKKYAEEIKTDGKGSGLEGIIREKKDKGIFCGIMNGVDYSEWDPSVDVVLKKKYSILYNGESLYKKALIKKMFAEENGLSLNKNTPLIGIITRLYDQKGLDIFFECVEELLKQDIAFTVLGTGKKDYEERLKQLAIQYPKRMNVVIGFNIERSHEIEAACDMFLMPSRFEPSGLNQLYSLRYGTVPIVRKTGGLADSVTDGKTGFVFEEYHPDSLKETILKATNIWRHHKLQWEKIVKTGIKQDWSWKRSAKGYLNMYNSILSQ